MSFAQAARLDDDGGVAVRRIDGRILIEVTSGGKYESISASDFNASRVLAMLAIALCVRLVKADAQEIRL